MKIMITRHGGNCEEYDAEKIRDIKWDNVSGGYRKKQSGYSLYGYIPYDDAVKMGLSSGNHEKFNNDAKIMIPADLNSKAPYKKVYDHIVSLAGEKPLIRKPGQLPCTKRAIDILCKSKKRSLARSKLREVLLTEGYKPNTIMHALKRLGKEGKIVFEGSPYSKVQIIKLP